MPSTLTWPCPSRKTFPTLDLEQKRELLLRVLKAAEHYGWNIHFEVFDQIYLPAYSNHPHVLFELTRYSLWVRVGNLLLDMPEPPYKPKPDG